MADEAPLAGLRVVDLSTDLAGPYCGRLLAAAGADVVKIDPPEGDPMRSWSASGATLQSTQDSAMYRFLNSAKARLIGRLEDAEVERLLVNAAVVIESFVPAALDLDLWRERRPDLVILSITPFGRSGPWRDRAASDFTIDAEAGAIATLGRPEGSPVRVGVRITEYIAGVYGAVAVGAALRRARQSGAGEHIDLSITETANATATALAPIGHELAGRPEIDTPARWVEVPGVEPTADGMVGITLMSRQQFDDFLVMIDRADLLGNEDWPKLTYRSDHMDEWNAIVHAWTRKHTTAEILELASAFRIPSSPISDAESVTAFAPFVERGSIGAYDDGAFVGPLPPIRIDGGRLQLRGGSHRFDGSGGQSRSKFERDEKEPSAAGAVARPLEGLRVLDATGWFAGPVAGQLLAALGADVIHLESHVRLEGGRTVIRGSTDGAWWERGLLFHHANVGKRSLAVDLNQEAGRDVVRRVIAGCDVIVENYSPRVFENFGLGWEELHRLNPRVSLVRMPAFGLDSSWRDRPGFAETMEQCTGMAWLTGFTDQPPYQPAGPGDPLAGAHGAFGALLALARRDGTGEGSLVEVAMAEALLNAAAEPLVEFSAYGRKMDRNANRTSSAAPQGLYRCLGVEQWLALTVRSDADWQGLRAVMGDPDWASEPSLDTAQGRLAAHDRIDAELSAWAATQVLSEAVAALISVGISAGSLTDPRIGRLHPQFQARGFYEEVEHAEAGRLAIGTIPFRLSTVRRWWAHPAPLLGQHNREVLSDIAGLADEAIDRLESDGVIGRRPAGLDVSVP